MPPALELLVQPRLTPSESVATDHLLLARVRDLDPATAGVLRVFTLAGDVLGLGRWHVAPPAQDGGPALLRRHGGGRVVPAGEGFVGVSLVLRHRAALVGDDPGMLDPTQVLNRAVRGILAAWERAGVPAIYPGRDTITVQRRAAGVLSLDETAAGACLVEAVLAVERDFSVLPALLDVADPGGTVPATMVTTADATSLARERGAAPALAEIARWLGEGYATRLGVTCVPRALTPDERATIAASAAREFGDTWLASRRHRGDRRGTVTTQLGVLEVSFREAAGRLHDVTLAGDFIANTPAIARLESGLEGCAADRAAVAAVVAATFAEPGNFILGIAPLDTIADAIARGLAS